MINTKQSLTEKELVLIKAAQSSFINFCDIVDPNYQVSWHHEEVATQLQKALEDIDAGKKVRIILELPPRHGKSDQATIKFPAYVLGKNPKLPIVVASYSAELAEDFGRKTRDLMNDEQYKKIFGTRLRPDTQAVGRWLTKANGGYTAAGIGGAITGRGFKIGIIDDPLKNREEADSIVYRDKIWNWYTSTFYTRQEGNGAIVVICTRWHVDDLVGRLLEKQKEDEAARTVEYDRWQVIRFPALAEENELHRDKGEALWPEKFSVPMLENIRNTLGPYDWFSLYQQSPIATENAEFRQEYSKYFEEGTVTALKNFEINILIDPAISKKKESANTAIVAVGRVPTEPDWYILDYAVGKMDPGQLIDALFMIYSDCKKKYQRAVVKSYFESVAYQKSLEYFIKEEMKRRQTYFIINEYKDSSDKNQRIRGLIPLFRTGVIWHRRRMKELEAEALTFPNGKTVDILDAISFNLQITKPTKEERAPVKQPEHQPLSEFEGS